MTSLIVPSQLIILLPGIMGSVLQQNGRDLWAISRQGISEGLLSLGSALNQLVLHSDDHLRDDLGDGITAHRLLPDIWNIPDISKGGGYATIVQRLESELRITRGDIAAPQPHQNFFPFPYDWRRDIRVAADQLRRFIEFQLPRWQAHCGKKDAKVLLVAHSMGGLVARAYVELLGGWEVTEALFTLGTPHRGSLDALETISNGLSFHAGPVNLALRDLTSVVRTFTSLYQLLPIYPVLLDGGEPQRIAEAASIPNLDVKRAQDARTVLLDIDDAAQRNQREPGYATQTIPIVGVWQDTYQSAFRRTDGGMELSYHPPPGLAADFASGDGTVPQLSAIPIALQERGGGAPIFAIQHHGWLPNGTNVLTPLLEHIKYLVSRNSLPTRGVLARRPQAINLRLADLYAADESVAITAQVLHTPEEFQPLRARIRSLADGTIRREPFLRSHDHWLLSVEGLTPGLYEIEVQPAVAGGAGPEPITSAFEVVSV